MKKRHIIILCIALILLIIGTILLIVDKSHITQASHDFAYEYNSLNGEGNEYGKYRKINIPENNPFKEVSIDKINNMVNNKESFIVYFGFPECPWCRSMLETFTYLAKKNHIKTIYYGGTEQQWKSLELFIEKNWHFVYGHAEEAKREDIDAKIFYECTSEKLPELQKLAADWHAKEESKQIAEEAKAREEAERLAAEKKAEELLALLPQAEKRIALCVKGTFALKTWPKEYFVEVVDALAEWYDAAFFIVGAPNDREYADEVIAAMHRPVMNFCGETSLVSLAALIRASDLFVTVDTGAAHIAATTGVPMVTMYGCTSPKRWYPINEHARVLTAEMDCCPCSVRPEDCPGWPEPECLWKVTPDMVLEQCKGLL